MVTGAAARDPRIARFKEFHGMVRPALLLVAALALGAPFVASPAAAQMPRAEVAEQARASQQQAHRAAVRQNQARPTAQTRRHQAAMARRAHRAPPRG
jgi:uncharacterized protein HemX